MGRDKDNIHTDPLTGVARKEKELTEHDLERARDGHDLGEKFGRQNIGPTVANKQALETKKREDEKYESLMRQALQQMREALERRLEELDRLIAENNDRIEGLKVEIETTEILLEKRFGKDWKEKLRKGDLDSDDPLLQQWLVQQQHLNDYLRRREKLIEERDDLEKQIAEIESSNVPDHLKLERMKGALDRGTSPGIQEVWRDNKAPQHVQEIAGSVNTGDGETIEAQAAGTMFAQIAGASFAEKAGIGSGIESKLKSITSTFAKAAEATTAEEPELATADIPPIKGPKFPG
ncbi:MAG: hypothetical protein NW701_17930 [Nitrospira sp.]